MLRRAEDVNAQPLRKGGDKSAAMGVAGRARDGLPGLPIDPMTGNPEVIHAARVQPGGEHPSFVGHGGHPRCVGRLCPGDRREAGQAEGHQDDGPGQASCQVAFEYRQWKATPRGERHWHRAWGHTRAGFSRGR